MTTLENCRDHDDVGEHNEHAVLLSKVWIEYVDGLSDTANGQYEVRTIDSSKKDLILTTYRCRTGSVGECYDNPEEFTEEMSCDKFTNEEGPWKIISNAMSGSKCGNAIVSVWPFLESLTIDWTFSTGHFHTGERSTETGAFDSTQTRRSREHQTSDAPLVA